MSILGGFDFACYCCIFSRLLQIQTIWHVSRAGVEGVEAAHFLLISSAIFASFSIYNEVGAYHPAKLTESFHDRLTPSEDFNHQPSPRHAQRGDSPLRAAPTSLSPEAIVAHWCSAR
jgi:hypothetical protein